MENNHAQVSENRQRIFHYTREMEKENRERDRIKSLIPVSPYPLCFLGFV